MKGRQAWHDLSAYVPFENFLLLFRPWRLRFRVPSCSKDKIPRVGVRGDKSFPGFIPIPDGIFSTTIPEKSLVTERKGICWKKYSIPSLSLSLKLEIFRFLPILYYNWFKHWIHFHALREISEVELGSIELFYKKERKERGWRKRRGENSSFVNTGGPLDLCETRSRTVRTIRSIETRSDVYRGNRRGEGTGQIFVEQESTRISIKRSIIRGESEST